MVVVVIDGLWLVVLWRWTLGVVDRLLMSFDVWDIGDMCDTVLVWFPNPLATFKSDGDPVYTIQTIAPSMILLVSSQV